MMTNTRQGTIPDQTEVRETRGLGRWALTALVLLAAGPTLTAAETGSPAPAMPAAAAARWENISDDLFKKLGVYDALPGRIRRCAGMAVAPTGEVLMLAGEDHGLWLSKDHGASWTARPDSKLTGRGETGCCFRPSYPWNGRWAVFTIDGQGGLTSDSGLTWRGFGKHVRGFDFGDVDWTAAEPKTIFALEHEPWFRCLSTDGGLTWARMNEEEDKGKTYDMRRLRLGVVNATTLVQGDSHKDGIILSKDLGKTWTEVSKHRVLGSAPAHYGKKLYWLAAEGIIATENGQDWASAGTGVKDASFGPYFGQNEEEMMVVSGEGFFISRDGAKTWKNAAPFFAGPDGITRNYDIKDTTGQFWYFGWDPVGNLIYASVLAGSSYRLKLNP